MFVLPGLYYLLQRHQPISKDLDDRAAFVYAKQTLALELLSWCMLIGVNVFLQFRIGETPHFFESFFTLLIFCGLLVVLISIRYTTTYSIVFRNSAFAVANVLIPLSLTPPPYYNIAIGVIAAASSED